MKKLLSLSAIVLFLLAGCSSEAMLDDVTSYNNDVQKEVIAADWTNESKTEITNSLEEIKIATSERDIEAFQAAKENIENNITNVKEDN